MASLTSTPNRFVRALEYLRRGDVLLRFGFCVIATLVLWGLTGGWAPPFPYRTGYVPQREIIARVEFSIIDQEGTKELKRRRRSESLCVYKHDARRLVEFRQLLKDKLFQLIRAESYDKLPAELKPEFFASQNASSSDNPATDMQAAFEEVQTTFADDMDLARFEKALQQTLADFERAGLIHELKHRPDEGSLSEILVHTSGDEEFSRPAAVRDVRVAEVVGRLETKLFDELKKESFSTEPIAGTVKRLAQWMKTRLPETLSLNDEATAKAREEIDKKVDQNPVYITFHPGESKLATAGRPLNVEDLRLLRLEHDALVRQSSFSQLCWQSLATIGMYVALYVLCGAYIRYCEPHILASMRRFVTLLGLAMGTIAMCWFVQKGQLRAEMVPLILFGMTIAIAYHQELALLLSASVALVVTLTLGQGLAQFVVMAASVAASILLLGRIRSRTRLTYVGAMVAIVSFLTSLGVCALVGEAYGSPDILTSPAAETPIGQPQPLFVTSLLTGASWSAFCAFIAGLLMTGLLPFVEKLFDVQTDISLLELGDARHPLLQELVRRAPGTYNHSINVASIGEAAAEAIGGNGLLVRVGAYFHDIGKMLKPSYYIENQGQDVNRHQSLLPAMSTLVIIAHVKDGANLAHQHHLPQSIVDFIEQHHGTTLVEYFYRQATKQSEADPDASEVDETSFRYPGPKPQTKETAVLMLADAVESASRSLADPTPSRIENLVGDIAMKRLLDGQFEECGLTLQELHVIQESLSKSLTSVYHGRVRYPDQQTA